MNTSIPERRRCANGGAAVGPQDWLPDTPHDRDFGDLFPAVGCTNLRCAGCGEAVTHRIHGSCRRYRCACATLDAVAPTVLGSGASPLDDPLPPWACAGHPRVALPLLLDGVELREELGVDGLARAVLDGGLPPSRPWPDAVDRPAYWLVRVAALLLPGAIGAALCEAVVEHADGTDPLRTRGAWEFFHHLPSAPGAERLGAAFLLHRARLAGTLDPVAGKTPLHTYALHTLERRLAVSDDALPALRAGVLDGVHSHHGLFTLGLRDAPWLARHADDYLSVHPSHLRTIAGALGGRETDAFIEAVVRFSRGGADAHAAVSASLGDLPEGIRSAIVGRR